MALIYFGIDHEYQGEHLLSFDTETHKFSHYWLERKHFDERKSIITLFNFDPFTGEKIDMEYLKSFLRF